MSSLGTALKSGTQRQSTPTFTVRMAQTAKADIRKRLRETMGLDHWTIYPDILGLASLGHVILIINVDDGVTCQSDAIACLLARFNLIGAERSMSGCTPSNSKARSTTRV
jgi:hypothetical protein